MITLKEFISKIKSQDIAGNETMLSIKTDGRSYHKFYQNTVNTKENMINDFAVTYYPLIQEYPLIDKE